MTVKPFKLNANTLYDGLSPHRLPIGLPLFKVFGLFSKSLKIYFLPLSYSYGDIYKVLRVHGFFLNLKFPNKEYISQFS